MKPRNSWRSILPPEVVAVILLAFVMAASDQGGDGLRAALLLESGAVLRGEIWRPFTAHLVNLGHSHTWMNITGFVFVFLGLWSIFSLRTLMTAVVASATVIGVGWIVLVPPGEGYVGFSGIIHGLLAYGALTTLAIGPRWLGALLAAFLAAKLGHELLIGPIPGIEAAIGGKVSTLSHALGALGGVLVATRATLGLRATAAGGCLVLSLLHAPLLGVSA